MPRLTKAQKEARSASGKPVKKAGKPGTAKSSGGGFKVGPAHAPRNAYLGKAQKKKAELIAAAKVKQQYAKVLAREGMQSVRVGGKGGVSARGALPDAGGKGKGKGKEREEGERARLERRMAAAMADADEDDGEGHGGSDDSDADSDDDSDSDAEDEAARAAARMRQAAREADEARAERRERKAFERGKTGTEKAFRPGRRPLSKQAPEARTVRALSPPKVEPREGRLRDLKREAFGKRHAGRAGGQPRMGARMDVLLEKIRRSKS
ncbi:hypothetical protein CC85DRAFT_330752 [Cutaneotrichosporon oleaginosum]|uniref:rRNA-processing protein FYV7 n=1 Tax=Cutaneotrichosporon oleaginosum TaxID=879819 RepID=A0A0J0XEF9_9TREE|nr:uncharacterized protein CC85DRAFT_330752 [Cutaneotrichosporon oleaginosum]KLT39442.1 hypothetical protein CC85DRAFT_330752 [Cutaneotrichosporon oleaginosum]TXT08448.1 hypothetical protein COLE_05372 [Cutaneotrichosporon oleaginosum]